MLGNLIPADVNAVSVMDKDAVIHGRLEKLKTIKSLLNETEDRLLNLTKEFNWDYKKLSEESSTMVTCSIHPQHRMPITSLKAHEQKCTLSSEGYTNTEKTYPEHSGCGSFVILTPEALHSITKNVSSSTECKPVRAVPQSSANFDQNFEREEKLAIYDYVIANTPKPESFPDLWLQPAEKSEEKREMSAWEIAAAERDAKRRRASYRNKVHTNRKTHTEILREVIESQMEAFKEDIVNEKTKEFSRPDTVKRKSNHESREFFDKRKRHDSSSHHQNKEDRNKRRNHDKHRERSPFDAGSDTKSRSRFNDKHRKWKTYEGRSHSHRSSHTHRR